MVNATDGTTAMVMSAQSDDWVESGDWKVNQDDKRRNARLPYGLGGETASGETNR